VRSEGDLEGNCCQKGKLNDKGNLNSCSFAINCSTKNPFQSDEVSANPWQRQLTSGLHDLLENAFVHSGKDAMLT
jgi:hypothetical protein